ncbi:carboxymuconolactone decarboxylase family protein [Actinoplanes sp. NPDC000266]
MIRLPDPDPSSLPAGLPPDPMVKMLSHSPATVELFVQLARAQFASLALPARSRELVILTVAVTQECSFELAQHEPIALRAGLEPSALDLIRRGRFDDPLLSDHDRTLIRFTTTVLAGPAVGDELFASVRAVLAPREIVEVLQVIGYYWTFSRINTVLQVPLTEVYN